MIIKRVPLAEEAISDEDAVAGYDAYARLYIMPEYKYFVRKILNRGIRSGRVLDLGTGSGRLAIELAKAKGCNFDIVGLDISAEMLKKAGENARQAGVNGKIKFVLATACRLPFPDRSLDLVMSYASLHHWHSPETTFDEIGRICKENGTIMIRDNRRVYGNLFWETFIRLISLFQSRQDREKWRQAILASYTIQETKDILEKSSLKNYHIGTDFIKFDISIETARKNKKKQ